MRYNQLGKTGLYVSELCLGAMTFGGKGIWQSIGQLGETEAQTLVGTALDAGVNFIDTADVYSEGDSEKLVGGAMRSLARPREQVVIATKVRGRVGPGVNQVGLSRAHSREHRWKSFASRSRSRRPLSNSRIRSRDADRRDGARAR